MIRFFLIITIFFNYVVSNKLTDNEYVHDFKIDETSVSIDVFKSTKNDAIIGKNDVTKFNQLEWVSIGDPHLYQDDNRPIGSLGFYIKIQMLSNSDKDRIQDMIKEKHNITVNTNQIRTKKINQMECTIQFEKDNLKGTVKHYNQNPLEVYFNYKEDSKELNSFLKFIKENYNEDLNVSCLIQNNRTGYSQNITIEIPKLFKKKLLGIDDNYLSLQEKIIKIEERLSSVINEFKKVNKSGLDQNETEKLLKIDNLISVSSVITKRLDEFEKKTNDTFFIIKKR
jgi:hypothetical protein